MNRADLLLASENIFENILRRTLPEGVPVHLFGSRSRGVVDGTPISICGSIPTCRGKIFWR